MLLYNMNLFRNYAPKILRYNIASEKKVYRSRRFTFC